MPKHSFHFSPFAALGLSPSGQYDESQIRKAFRTASLHCHPDRRHKFGIQGDRWPTISDLEASRDYLIQLLDHQLAALCTPPHQFQHFPSAFNPAQRLGAAEVYPSWNKPGFVSCEECSMPLIQTKLNDHLSTHGIKKCHFCDAQFELGAYDDHCLTCDQKCDCEGVEDIERHVARKHVCPHCRERCLNTTVAKHIAASHRCRCPGRNESNHIFSQHTCCGEYHFDLKKHFSDDHRCECLQITGREHYQHVQSAHRCHQCYDYALDLDQHYDLNHTCPPCDRVYIDRAQHIANDHCCKLCNKYCDDIDVHSSEEHYCEFCGADFPDLEEHDRDNHFCELCEERMLDLERHVAEHCPLPSCAVLCENVERLLFHLNNDHLFRFCQGCQPMTTTKNLFSDHVTTHEWASCPGCDNWISRQELLGHVQQDHRWQKCDACPDLGSVYAKGHFQTAHAKQSCPSCGILLYAADLEEHLIDDHDWKRCPFCKGVNESSEHIESAHQPRPCPDCSEEHPSSDMGKHLCTAHAWRTCPFCYSMLSPEDADHVERFHAPCAICGERVARAKLKIHEKTVHLFVECEHCNESFHPDVLPTHQIATHAFRECPNPGCKENLEVGAIPAHMMEVHLLKKCWCGSHAYDLREHMSSHADDYQQGNRCVICEETVHGEREELLSHAWSHLSLLPDSTNNASSTKSTGRGPSSTDGSSANVPHPGASETDISFILNEFGHKVDALIKSTLNTCLKGKQKNEGASRSLPGATEGELAAINESTSRKRTASRCGCGFDKPHNLARHKKTCDGISGNKFGPKWRHTTDAENNSDPKRPRLAV